MQVSDLTINALEPWLIGLKLAERTRRNVRDCVAYFVKWAKGRNYLPKDADPLAHVQNFRKRKLEGLVFVPGLAKALQGKASIYRA